MIFPTTNTCPNTLPYPYDVHSWAEYAFYFVIIFKHVSEKNYDTRPIPSILDNALAMKLDPRAIKRLGTKISNHCPTVVR
uniref:SFRICE_035405 n=1 Tax=Spodoptera frugiperda TaxID=7108 RepID=A0A2H1W3Y6_SPOFR